MDDPNKLDCAPKATRLWPWLLITAIVVASPVLIVSNRIASYSKQQRDTRELLASVRSQCPTSEDKETWERATGWLLTAHGNICFSDDLVTRSELLSFSNDVDAKLSEAPPNRRTVEWIWNRLGDTGAHGAFYIQKYNSTFRDSWN